MENNDKELSGTVESVTFRNDENGFTVLELESAGLLHTVVGVMTEVSPGESLKLHGSWQSHPSFGEQFRALTCERYLPATANAVLRYLSSGAVKGIGAATARRIVERFGDSTLEVLEKQPELLATIKGISRNRAEDIGDDYQRHLGIRETMLKLASYGITAAESLVIWKKWGLNALDIVRSTPYLLCTPDLGISFERADDIARRLEHPPDDEYRIMAGVLHVLNHNLGNGHTCVPADKLVLVAQRLLKVEAEIIEEQIEAGVEDRELISDTIGGRRFIFLPRMYEAETYCAGRLTLLAKYPPPPIRDYLHQIEFSEALSGMKYNTLQREAICAAMERGALVLTGGPGTGKTTTLNVIIDTLETAGQRVAIAAPTGRAAKRITEITGHEAKTIHRLLEVEWGENDIPHFARNERNPLECDALIVDELSMTDVLLFESLLRAVHASCRLILVGDSDQLPSVGAGNVLGDLISSGCLPVAQLKEVFRQAQESAIVMNAHRIVEGELPDLERKTGDFFFIGCSNDSRCSETICDLCYRRLPEAYGFDPMREIQVLCPSRKGVCGTWELNKQLQQRFNPPNPERKEIKINSVVFREGDKVMQIKNNYDVEWYRDDGSEGTGIFNGDVGILLEINKAEETLRVKYDDRTALYTLEAAEQLEHAYAITVHKSQGSEFGAVIIPVMPTAPQLCYRNLLYTAVTRAKRILILIGQRSVVERMTMNVKKIKRYTALDAYLRQEEDEG